jgi:hypothetical protein
MNPPEPWGSRSNAGGAGPAKPHIENIVPYPDIHIMVYVMSYFELTKQEAKALADDAIKSLPKSHYPKRGKWAKLEKLLLIPKREQ